MWRGAQWIAKKRSKAINTTLRNSGAGETFFFIYIVIEFVWFYGDFMLLCKFKKVMHTYYEFDKTYYF